jgi:hypothetical protein
MNVNLHIERLVLDGVALERGEESLLRAAVESELARLLADGGLASSLASGGAMPRLRAASIELPDRGDSRQLGQRIAAALYGGIGK